MFYKNRIGYVLALLGVLAVAATSAIAQANSLTGIVKLKKDGATNPIAGITVGCFNLTDFTAGTSSSCTPAKTDASGTFSLTGLTDGAKYILSIGGEGIGPRITVPVKAGDKVQDIVVEPGDGRVLSKLEVWQGFAFGGSSADQKKAREMYEAATAKTPSRAST